MFTFQYKNHDFAGIVLEKSQRRLLQYKKKCVLHCFILCCDVKSFWQHLNIFVTLTFCLSTTRLYNCLKGRCPHITISSSQSSSTEKRTNLLVTALTRLAAILCKWKHRIFFIEYRMFLRVAHSKWNIPVQIEKLNIPQFKEQLEVPFQNFEL